jgi:Putative beta-barrel porin-2, OmpL-like. bbp2
MTRRSDVQIGIFMSLFSLAVLQTPSRVVAQSLPSNQTAPGEPAQSAEQRITDLTHEVQMLKAVVQQLQDQVSHWAPPAPSPSVAATVAPPQGSPPPKVAADVLRSMTISALIDGYYEYNLHSPVGRINELRAYDVSSNSFSLNQAALILESAPDLAADKRYGGRIDLQFGQATSTLQGNPANELRPDIYRNVFQAYGTYVFPVAQGLTVDFGKWASSLGLEGNYTKDQLNYSRSFWFDFLPFYHMGLRSKLAISDQLAVNAWITNGANQTEDFNNDKDQMLGILVTPNPAISWTLNYYRGQEHPDVVYLPNVPVGTLSLPLQQGTYVLPIADAPDGLLQIVDSYVTWQATRSLTLAAEADYVQQRLYSFSSPARVSGGALYAAYQLTPKLGLAARAEYLADIGGLYSGETQYLKEATISFDYRPMDGFLMRAEYRRDSSNQLYFLTHTLGAFDATQPTIGVGLVWWFGQKDGIW